ncbi:NAD(P)-binding protein [Heliocybe sulcata]|uniref:NAD(P)-binding protein n=1 Tax=Heliocybe sulcata TaxID=5364 RepID=A0A5C3MXM7_9AGAM|nr:NAD(P)-binding protein [Heliocybe sulcata]
MPTIADSKCVLIIGATAGIGQALARALVALPSKPKVIVNGRRKERLDELRKEGFETIEFDVDTNRPNLKHFVDTVIGRYPELDTVVFSAAIQNELDFSHPDTLDLDVFMSELNINYISIITMIKFFLSHLIKRAATGQPCFIIPITSTLGIVPGPWVPTYAATKAALHSISITLNEQLDGTGVHIMEVMPPLTESELHDHQGKRETLQNIWMPLDEFTKEEMEGLLRGDTFIPCGETKDGFMRFEKGRVEAVHAMYAERRKHEDQAGGGFRIGVNRH